MGLTLSQRINSLAKLGEYIASFLETEAKSEASTNQQQEFAQTLIKAGHTNSWFTAENLRFALDQWAQLLTVSKLTDWTSNYSFTNSNPKTVAIIMAGNIPLVGIHDLICVLISGNKALVKLSSNDTVLLPYLTSVLINENSQWETAIRYTKDRLDGFDAVIATGSTNTSRYFEHYFGKYPSIIRKNRSSVAVLTGSESKEDLLGLSNDILRYYGLGCRNVSKIYVPKDYNFDAFFNAIYSWNAIIELKKYENNYDYNKAVYLMSQFDILDNGFFMIKEDESLSSPIASLFYEYYTNEDSIKETIGSREEEIQCVVSTMKSLNGLPFGQAQHPQLADYADQIDTLAFLLKL